MTKHSSDISKILDGAKAYGLSLDDHASGLLMRYTDLVREGNLQTNLVSKRDIDRFITHHLLDSLKIVSCTTIPREGRLLDFGSGAGLPGIPLAISYPALETILVDSRRKRCIFLESVVHALGLTNVSVICSRLETFDHSHDGTYGIVTTRGTVSLDSFYSVAGRFLTSDGSLISIKGEAINAERKALETVINHDLFNILYTQPAHVSGVRDGTVVVITKH